MFAGKPSRLRFAPAGVDGGIVFVRTSGDTAGAAAQVRCDAANVVKRSRRTSLANGSVTVETVEHVLSAVWGLGIDNLTMELDAEEVPAPDSSPMPFVEALQQAGIEEQQAERKVLVIDRPISISDGPDSLVALPGPGDYLEVLYDLDYGETSSIGRQLRAFRLGKDDYAAELGPARTFVLKQEAEQIQAGGVGKHLSAKDVVVMEDAGVLDNELRFEDEHVRHKLCDLIGDLALVGRRVHGRIIACRSGHKMNQELARRLCGVIDQGERTEPIMDIRRILRLLPHRYPFLMVDRVVEMDGERRAVGIKNVTINEPFFQGHYPGQPIMPGVLVLEALAQLSGLLLGRRLEHTGKVAVLLSMDRVKMRRPVRPGDQLILEAETIHVRARTGHCRCRALVEGNVAAEAQIKFMLVDAEPV